MTTTDFASTDRATGGQTTLGETQPGDVFYLDSDPSLVYMRHPRAPRWADDHFFKEMRGDAWRRVEHVGTGMSDQAVTVVHNTEKEPT
jgi:hypothetical protein